MDDQALLGISAADAAITNLRDYGLYTLSTKMPNLIDGLKSGQRHILLTLGTTTSFDKGAALVGAVMNKHPHGDQAVGDTLIRMAQIFRHAFPLVCMPGNVGSYSGDEPAAMRYLDVTSAEFTRDVYFNDVDERTFIQVPSETGKGFEPLYLIPKLPMALLTNAFAIAVGFSTYVPSLNLVNICHLVREYIRKRKIPTGSLENLLSTNKLASLMIPDYPSPCIIRNAASATAAYKSGTLDVAITTDGIMTVTPNSISLHALPPGIEVSLEYTKILEAMKAKDERICGWFQEMRDRSSSRTVLPDGTVTMTNMEADFLFVLRRGLNPFDILSEFKRMLSFTRDIRPRIRGLNSDGAHLEATQLQILEMWYHARCRSISAHLCYLQNDLIDELRKLSAMLIIHGRELEVAEIFKTAKTKLEVEAILVKRFKLTRHQAAYVGKLQLSQLTAEGKDELLKREEETRNKLSELQKRIVNIDQQVLDDMDMIEKKYAAQAVRHSRLATYKGCVKVPGGMIQYWDDSDREEILEAWKAYNPELHLYPDKPHVYVVSNASVISNEFVEHPKETACSQVVVSTKSLSNTVIIRDKKIFRVSGIAPVETDKNTQYAYVSDRCVTISKMGKVNVMFTSELPLRKTTTATGIATDVIYVGNVEGEFLPIIAYGNSAEPNVLRFMNLVSGTEQLRKVAVGHLVIAGVFNDTHTEHLINIPKDLLNRQVIRHILFHHKETVLNMGMCTHFEVAITNKTVSGKVTLKRHKTTDIYELVFH